jgi:hypothetical protein
VENASGLENAVDVRAGCADYRSRATETYIGAAHHGQSQESQSERIFRKVNELTAAFAEVLFEMLPPDRQPLKDRFTKALGDLLAEVIGGSTVMAAGVVVALDKRVGEAGRKAGGRRWQPLSENQLTCRSCIRSPSAGCTGWSSRLRLPGHQRRSRAHLMEIARPEAKVQHLELKLRPPGQPS